jgi:hypothetical protein
MAKFFETIQNISSKLGGDVTSPTYETRKTFLEGFSWDIWVYNYQLIS